jgi:predicted acylesterase/phospholipase RssA
MNVYNSVCLSGGGVQGFQVLGVLSSISENSCFSVNEFIGTSVGSMICYLLSIRYTPMEILTELTQTRVFDKLKYPNYMQMVQTGGATSFAPIQEFLETITIKKIGKLLTMSQLKEETGNTFKCVTFNYSKKTVELLSPETTPDIPCITAVRMSCTVPFMFPPYKYGDSYYIDGGLAFNFPQQYVTNKQCLGIYVISEAQKKGDFDSEFNPVSYALDILNIPINSNTKESAASFSGDLVKIPNAENTTYNFGLDTTEKLNLFSVGYQIGKKFINS